MIKQNCAARVLDGAQLHGFRADMVANDHEIDHGIVLEPTPSHTPGHVALNLQNGRDSALFTGVLFHYPMQIAEPQPSSGVCIDADLSRAFYRQ